MALVWEEIGARESLRCLRHRTFRIAAANGLFVTFERTFAYELRQILVHRKPLPGAPIRFQGRGCSHSCPFVARDYSKKVLDANNADVRNPFDRLLINRK